MYLEIVTPEAVLLSSEVDSVAVPGVNGEFQMLNNHAPIVSLLGKGMIKVYTHSSGLGSGKLPAQFQRDSADNKILLLPVDGGVVEMKGNKVIVLAD